MNPFKEIDEIKRTFWDYPNYPFVDEVANVYYTSNYERLKRNAESLFEERPEESAIFWLQLIRSPFFIKFGHDINAILNHKNEISTTEQAVGAIKTVFESAYQYFGFIAICEYLDKNTTDDLYESWQNPDKAKELPKSSDQNPWIDGKEIVTGKVWAINNCPLFHLSSHNLKLLKRIRNADSHDKLVAKKDKIVLLDKAEPEIISKEEVIKIANHSKGVINLCCHFYGTLLIRDRFWIFLSIFYANKPEYGLKKVPLEVLSDDTKREETKAKKSFLDIFDKKFLTIGIFCFKYMSNDLWVEMKRDVPKLNNYLAKMGMEMNEEKIEFLRENAICDLFNAFVTLNKEFRKFLKISEFPFEEIHIDQIESSSFDSVIKDTIALGLEANKSDKPNRGIHLFILLMFSGLSALIEPFNRLMENLKDLAKPIRVD